MIRFLKKIRDNFNQISTLTIFLSAILIVTFLLPRERKLDFEYSKGKPWVHNDLTAQFSFPIYKTDARYKKEKDSILALLEPMFSFNNKESEAAVAFFTEDFNSKWTTYTIRNFSIASEKQYLENKLYETHRALQKKYLEFAGNEIRKVISAGIVHEPDRTDIDTRDLKRIKLINNNVIERVPYSTLYTPKSAYKHIINVLEEELAKEIRRMASKYGQFFKELEINKYLVENVFYDADKTDKERKELLKNISQTQGGVLGGELIVSKGEIVTQQKYQILESYNREYSDQLGNISNMLAWLGRIMLTSISFLVIYLFLYNFRKEILLSFKRTAFLLFMMAMMLFIASTTASYDNSKYYYIIPFTILPVIIRTFYDERIALFIHIITILLASFMAVQPSEFIFINLITGMVAIYSLTNIYHRSKFFLAALFVFISYSMTYFGISVIKEGSFSFMDWSNYKYFGFNSILMLPSFLLIYLFEKIFGFLSDTTLMELSDTNQPLLRNLAEMAPATFQHSLQVANLSEEAIRIIGGNPLLVRTGALYHDIGKIINSEYFTENQIGGVNPHSGKDMKDSVEIIIGHVEKGRELARKANLPEAIINFIVSHHGTSTAKYFYKTYQNQNPGKELDKTPFQYPGPKPVSKETAVLMMADSVEAASRSLDSYSTESIDELVERIINSQIDEGQFEEADITFLEIKKVKNVFKSRLKTIYHARIAYPK